MEKCIDVITDVGEECDDEVACLWLYELCAIDPMLFARVFCTDPQGKANFMHLLIGGSDRLEIPNFNILDFNESTFNRNDNDDVEQTTTKRTLLVQIGPIQEDQLDICKAYAAISNDNKPFDYILLGELGKTLNSNKNARAAADFFLTKASYGVCVATKGGEGAPKFTVADLEPSIGGPDSAIVNHVIKIGFRNSVGRAGAGVGGRYVAHLVAAHARGANYQTVMSIATTLGIASNPASWQQQMTATKKPLTLEVGRQHSIVTIVDKYIAALLEHGLIVAEDGKTNSPCGVTISEIKEGYAFILDVLDQAFGVPLDFFSSQTSSGEWDTCWEFTSGSPKFKETFSGISDVHEQMITAYATFKIVIKANPTMQLTPAYDVVAIAAAVDFLYDGNIGIRFDTVSDSEIILKSSERQKGLMELLKMKIK